MITPGDYISFATRVRPKVTSRIKDLTGTTHVAVLEEEKWQSCSGSGLVLKVAKAAKKIGDVKHRTARVDAGPWLKVITVSIDDAVVIGEQYAMFKQEDQMSSVKGFMYGDGAGA